MRYLIAIAFGATWIGATLSPAHDVVTAATVPAAVAQEAQDASVADPPLEWPRELETASGGRIVVYQPQTESWADYVRLEGRTALAFAATAGAEPEVGTARMTAATETDLGSKLVRVYDVAFEDVRFPALSSQQSDVLAAELKRAADGRELVVELDRLVADLEEAQVQSRPVSVNTDPPAIFVSTTPAVLIQFDGEPVVSPIEGSEVKFVVNTNWDVLQDPATGRWYALSGDFWLAAADLGGPWAPATAPASFGTLPADDNWAGPRDHVSAPAMPAGAAPRVFTSEGPAELILMAGEPQLALVPETRLLWVNNTESDLFLSREDGRYYYLVSGRWFSTDSLTDGPWTFASTSLPEDFAAIPPGHESADVLASVPGTPQAAEAAILAHIPQKARVDRTDVDAPPVRYEGDPAFESIPGTNIARAVNTASDILRIGDLYYLCFQGVWFRSTEPTGPWVVTDDVPASVYTIPEESPVYHVTYVTVEDSHDDWVEFAVMAGYMGMFYASDWHCVVWGTGWYYPPYVYYGPRYPVYYPYMHSYGGGAWYNPARGTYGRSVVGYGPYGGLGYGATYNPRTGTYARGAAAYGPYGAGRTAQAYNPRTGTVAATRQGTNYYESWGTSAVARGNDWVRTGRYSNASGGRAGAVATSGGRGGFVGVTGNNNVYAGSDGSAYRRVDGQWQRHGADGWGEVAGLPAADRARLGDREPASGGAAAAARQRATTTSPASRPTLEGLTRDSVSRSRGTQRIQRSRVPSSRPLRGRRR